jgi:biotin carboxyl carrier protein
VSPRILHRELNLPFRPVNLLAHLVGSTVKTGDPICILNAMKMETVVSAPIDGKILEIFVKQNDSISPADLIAKIVRE